MRSVIINANEISPLPRQKWDSLCNLCHLPQARWEWKDQGATCALCYLYETDWGKKRLEDLSVLLTEIEKAENLQRPRTADGKLLTIQDANVFLGRLAITSRMVGMVEKMRTKNG
jgi:hypothetical protein